MFKLTAEEMDKEPWSEVIAMNKIAGFYNEKSAKALRKKDDGAEEANTALQQALAKLSPSGY